jgi:O-antigen biosynthesis protein WbqV
LLDGPSDNNRALRRGDRLKFIPRLTPRMALILCHDALATGVALLAAFYLRFAAPEFEAREGILWALIPAFALYGAVVYLVLGTYRAAWRFTSLPDLLGLVKAATVLAVTLLVVDYVLVAPNAYGGFFLGKKTIAVYWVLQIFILGFFRIVYRYVQADRRRSRAVHADPVPALAIGRAAEVEVLLMAIESGAVQRLRVVGILSPSVDDQLHSVRGVRVVGRPGDLEAIVSRYEASGTPLRRIVFAASALAPDAAPEKTLAVARRLGIPTSRLPSLDSGQDVRLAPIDPEELLLRPGIRPAVESLQRIVSGRSVLVTGGGGSIGAEICRRLADLGAGRLMVLENSEPALYAVTEELARRGFAGTLTGHIGDVRDRARMFALLAGFRPDIVFHAAALKHVPILEADWIEGVKTNVLGTINVSDAAVAAGAAAVVAISTDKAVNPVSVLGQTKRLAEMYCQSLDEALRTRSDGGQAPAATRLINVRFGNVLASNGSVVPKFRAQIEAGGPITVTHPDMVRYFMTIGEACDLVITAAGHALDDGQRMASVYVLNMGQPVRIADLAERMIRLSGLEPDLDIRIDYTGIRPGERMHETLFSSEEPTADVGLAGVLASRTPFPDMDAMQALLARLDAAFDAGDRTVLARLISPAAWAPADDGTAGSDPHRRSA